MSEEKQPYITKAEIDGGRIVPPSLHPAEAALIGYIRGLRYGSLTIKVQHGLPQVAEEIRVRVELNRKGGE